MPVFDPADPPANLWPELESDGLERLRYWQQKRAEEAAERERRAVDAALDKAPRERTAQDEAAIAYSPYGSGQSCLLRKSPVAHPPRRPNRGDPADPQGAEDAVAAQEDAHRG